MKRGLLGVALLAASAAASAQIQSGTGIGSNTANAGTTINSVMVSDAIAGVRRSCSTRRARTTGGRCGGATARARHTRATSDDTATSSRQYASTSAYSAPVIPGARRCP